MSNEGGGRVQRDRLDFISRSAGNQLRVRLGAQSGIDKEGERYGTDNVENRFEKT